MEILDKGKAEREEARKREQDNARRWTEDNFENTCSRFYQNFYEHLYEPVVEFGYTKHKLSQDAPPIENWETTQYGDSHGDSSFTCEGNEYEVHWVYRGGSDRAYWDDGYWPDWFLIQYKRLWWFPLIKRKVRYQVHRAQSVAAILEGDKETKDWRRR